MKPEPMNIAVSVSKYYLPYTYVMLHSLLKNNACPIDVYILHRELCPADFDFLRTLTHTHPLVINDCRLSEDQIPLSADDSAAPAAPESLFYLSIPRILPADLPRILYLDSDVIVNAPLSALYAADLTHHMLAACQTASGIADGVLLFNLDCDASWEPFFLQKELSAVLPLDPKVYNLPARTAYTAHNLHYETVRTQAAIVHFCGSKPWEGNCFHCDIEQLWWDYAKDVPFYEDLMEQNDGQCHILLCEDWANNRYSGDTGYTGMVVLPDGTFVMDSYGHWDKEFSQSWQGSDGSGYNVKTDLCYIKQAKFKLADVIGESAIAVKDVTLDLSEVKLTERGQTVQLTATVAPKNATNKQVNFSSDREEVATVDEEGKVTAKADGTAVVTVTTVDGNKTAICSVTVEIPKDPKPDPTPAPKPSVPDNQESTTGSTMTVGSEQKSGKGIYRITGTRKTVTFVKPLNDKNTFFNVPASVKLADGRYKVTAIDKNAFKNNRKLKKVTIGNKVTKIGAGAFSGAKNLKAITIKSKLLKSEKMH